jgi:hypothetical protein
LTDLATPMSSHGPTEGGEPGADAPPRTRIVLDTSVLVADPSCLHGFGDVDVVIPFTVIEELDSLKTRLDDVGRAARTALRSIEDLRVGAGGSLATRSPRRRLAGHAADRDQRRAEAPADRARPRPPRARQPHHRRRARPGAGGTDDDRVERRGAAHQGRAPRAPSSRAPAGRSQRRHPRPPAGHARGVAVDDRHAVRSRRGRRPRRSARTPPMRRRTRSRCCGRIAVGAGAPHRRRMGAAPPPAARGVGAARAVEGAALRARVAGSIPT